MIQYIYILYVYVCIVGYCRYIVCKLMCVCMCAHVCEQMQVLSHNCTSVHACVQHHSTTALQKSSTQTGNLRRSVVLPPRGLICSLRRQPFFYLAFQIVSAQLLVTNLALVYAHNRFPSQLVRLICFARKVILSLPHSVHICIPRGVPLNSIR